MASLVRTLRETVPVRALHRALSSSLAGKTTVREPRYRNVPSEVILEEADKMGRLDVDHAELAAPRPVPTSQEEYALNRRAYRAAMKQARLEFRSEWDARRTREQEAVEEHIREVELEKAERAAVRTTAKARRAEEHQRQMLIDQEGRRVRKEAGARAQAYYKAKVAGARRKWLDALAADSESWIPEDKIDEMITPELFEMQFPWQFSEYFAHQARKRIREETATEGVAGSLSDDEDLYDSDWESDVDEASVDIWAPVDRALATGVQLHELYHEKRTAEVVEDFKQWRQEYMSKYEDEFDPVFLAADSDSDGMDTFSGRGSGQRNLGEEEDTRRRWTRGDKSEVATDAPAAKGDSMTDVDAVVELMSRAVEGDADEKEE